jgi:3-hydroxybutyryl-CoA dehydratase
MILKKGDNYKFGFKVTPEIHTNFIGLFNDNNPLHTDHQFALKKGFNGRVMHGNILNGFISFFIGECLPTKDVIIHSQEIFFKNPVYLNDELSFNATVIETYESVNTIVFNFTFKNDKEKIVAKGKIQIGELI